MRPQPKTTLIVTPRERFGVAVRSLLSIINDTDSPFELIYVDGKSPPGVAQEIAALCSAHGFTLLRHEHFLSPNQARNIGLREAATQNVVFIDNDVIVSPGWLRQLEECAEETGADVVAPLTCQREPLHTEVHQAGGEVAADLQQFFAGPADRRRLVDRHVHQGDKVEEIELARSDIQACEFHCALVKRAVFDRIGELDENLLATKEHLDFSLSVWATGGRVMMEPASVVTYLFPAGANKLTREDWPFFTLRWSPAWVRASLDHFRRKWQIEGDPYFTNRQNTLLWRYQEGITRPILKNLPVVGKKGRAQTLAVKIGNKALNAWGTAMARRHRKQFPAPPVRSAPQLAENGLRQLPVHS